jgi:short-subunit dehydrogenase
MAAFAGKVIILTGASQGIGKALAFALSSERPRLVLAARDEAALAGVETRCRELGATTLVVPTDVTDEAQCRTLVSRAVATFGGVDVVIHNAGAGVDARFDEMKDLTVFQRLYQLNVLGPVWVTHEALPHLKNSRGLIVCVASVAGLTGVPARTPYAASKHAVFGFFDSLRIELRGTGVDVTMVAPDFVQSEIHVRAYGADGRALGESGIREEKAMTAEECARLIVSAMRRRRRLLITSWRGVLGRAVRLVAPALIDRIAERAIRRGV